VLTNFALRDVQLNTKRKLDQLDGTAEEEEVENLARGGSSDFILSEATVVASASPCAPSSSSVPSIDVAPVATLSISQFPLQCSAQDVSFRFKKSKFSGKWKNAIITLLRRVSPLESITRGHLLWLSMQSSSTGEAGGMVDVVTPPDSDGFLVVQFKHQDSKTLVVHLTETQRLYECVVADCRVVFRFHQV
jgi:hypothetical protein